MRFAVVFTLGDGYTWSCEQVAIVEDESPEHVETRLGMAILDAIEKGDRYFTCYERKWEVDDMTYCVETQSTKRNPQWKREPIDFEVYPLDTYRGTYSVT